MNEASRDKIKFDRKYLERALCQPIRLLKDFQGRNQRFLAGFILTTHTFKGTFHIDNNYQLDAGFRVEMLNLNDNNKLHLSYLVQQDEVVLTDFCRLAWDYVVKGVNHKLYSTASDKLGITAQDLQHVIEALVHLMVEACKNKLSTPKFKEALRNLKFNDQHIAILVEFYLAKQTDINNTLLAGSVCLPLFKNLEWRIQAEIGSRALPEKLEPAVLLKLSLENSVPESMLLKADPGSLATITQALESALSEATNQHARRVQRRFQPS